MPTSHYTQLNKIVELIVLTDPKSILDIGVGFGKYGFLSREYLEFWGKAECSDQKVRIDGIEAFKAYITPVHDFIYDHMHIGNAIDIVPSLNTNYDLILFIDILEHFDYENGMKILEQCNERGRNILIVTPKKIGSQRAAFGNPFEAHKFQWRKKHFHRFANKFFVANPWSIICYIGDDARRVRKDLLKSKIKKHFPFLKHPYRIMKRWFNPSPNLH